jgi:hypothetical protein
MYRGAERLRSLTALPSSPLWRVVTGNSRGDYYHEERELWDPRTGEFVRADGGAIVRSKVFFTPKGNDAITISCGFTGGGRRIKGPTG